MIRSIRTLRGFTLLAFGLMAALAGVWFFVFARVAVNPRSTALVVGFFVFLFILFGWLFGTYLSRRIRDITHRIEHLQDVIQGGEIQNSPNGAPTNFEELECLWNATNDAVRGVAKERRKLTARAELVSKKLAETKELVQNFIFHLAHKLRTPLNSIRWVTEIMKNEEDGEISAAQRESLDALEHSAVAVLELVHDLQDVFTIQTYGRVSLQTQPCNLLEIVDDVAGQWAVPARQKRLRLRVTHLSNTLPEVLGDPVRLHRAVEDLIENAVRYTPPGGNIAIETRVITSVRRKMRGSWIDICVRDTGIGIPKEDQSRIFEEFFRARNAKDQWVDGTGIGLTLARMIAHAHHGDILFSSKKGKGSAFHLQIPVSPLKRERRVVSGGAF